ncbi:MAG: RagB/SusD family nutrient uptake outer membrane protein [Bacteroides sp.]|nr:RagB/SusD family nutrient uptake outer membrane protein [Bacteroides sp.]
MITAATLTLSSCQGDLMDLFPYDSISSGNMWKSENLADKGVNAIYSTLFKDYVGIAMYKFDCYGVSSDCRDQDYPILTAKITTSNGLFSDYWSQHYAGIHRANDTIAHLGSVPDMADTKKARLIAEAKALRAYFYYKLNSMYKGVPLYLEPIEMEECTQGRKTEQKIWETVIADLTDAINEANLPERYETGSDDFGRMTKSIAYALRGKNIPILKRMGKGFQRFRSSGSSRPFSIPGQL